MTARAYSYKRFSKPTQEKGDSLRRQTEDVNPEEIAKNIGLELDNKLYLEDRGLSGFTGENRIKGSFGEFLKLVESGQIANGSVLIIEHLDRMSREILLETVHMMTGILLKGVGIYTGMDDQYYTKDSFDFGQLVLSAQKLQAGHEESLKKSKRLKSAWKEKRQQAGNGGKKLTAMSPLWLKLSKDKTKFHIIEERAEAVRKIFELKSQGLGNSKIASRLNENPDIWQPPKSKRNKTGGWPESTIQRIIHDRRVLGEYQPHKKVDGKREPVGDMIPDYFPAIVDEDMFLDVQNRLRRFREKNGHPGGRTGKVKNIFSHITKCGQCGGSMHFIDKGNEEKYLRCDVSRRGLLDEDKNRVCEARTVPYEHFKQTFLNNLEELDYDKLLPNPDETQSEIECLSQKIGANQQRIRELEQQESNLVDFIARSDDRNRWESLEQGLEQVVNDRKGLEQENETLASQLNDMQKEAEKIRESMNKVTELRNLERSMETEPEQINLRTKLRGEIRKLVSRIDVFPLTESYQKYKTVDEPGIIQHMKSRSIDRIRIRFHSSNPDDPYKRLLLLKSYIDVGDQDADKLLEKAGEN